jgi:poly(hydroxyalkanoate) granule-associated protein
MSDDGPTINVTRGSNRERRERTESSGGPSPSASGLGLPGPRALVSGAIRGVRTAWWAGLGAFAVARDAGAQVFDALVAEGKSWEQARRERTEARAQEVQRLTDEEATVEAIEDRVRAEVNDVLQRVGVPHRDEVDDLRAQIDALSERVAQLRQIVENDDS